MPKIKNAKILILATDGFEQSELEVPRERLKAVAQLVHVAAPKERKEKQSIMGWRDHDWGDPVPVDVELSDASTSLPASAPASSSATSGPASPQQRKLCW